MILHQIRLEHLLDMFNARNDPRIMRWTRQSEPLTWAQHCAWFFRLDSKVDDMYVINHDKKFVGVCGITNIDERHHHGEFSLYIIPEMQGQRLGKQALIKLLDHGFTTRNLHVIWGETFEGNPARKLFESLGMLSEGKRREFYLKNNTWTDAYIYSLTKEDYGQCSWRDLNVV